MKVYINVSRYLNYCKAHLKSFNFYALKLRAALLCLGLGLAQLIKPLSGCPNPHFHSNRKAAAVNPFPLLSRKALLGFALRSPSFELKLSSYSRKSLLSSCSFLSWFVFIVSLGFGNNPLLSSVLPFTSAANRPRGSSTFVVRVGAFC